MQFLMGLDDIYQPLRSNLLSKEPLPTVKGDFAIISAEESHRATNSVALKTQTSVFASRFNSSNKQKSGSSSTLRCTHCNLNGHSVDKCYELIGYPSNYKKKSNFQRSQAKANASSGKNVTSDISTPNSQPFTSDQISQLMALLSERNTSASAAHMSGNFNNFSLDLKLNDIFCSNSNHSINGTHMWIVDSGAN
jgi:hypothetical protein